MWSPACSVKTPAPDPAPDASGLATCFHPWLNRFAWFTAGWTFLLVCVGATVTSTGSALAVPDWPLSYGTLFPRLTGGVLFEHSHRVIAGSVAICLFVLAAWVGRVETRSWVRRLSVLAAILVVIQAVLGGVTVLMMLPPQASASHAALAQAVFALTVTMALATSRSWLHVTPASGPRTPPLDGAVVRAAGVVMALVYLQIFAGAITRHTFAGLVFPDFPTSGGRWIPLIDSVGAAAQFTHRLGAVVVTVALWTLAVLTHRRAARHAKLVHLSRVLAALVIVQFGLGAAAIWTRLNVIVTVAHVATGAVIFVTTVAFYAWSRHARLHGSPALATRRDPAAVSRVVSAPLGASS